MLTVLNRFKKKNLIQVRAFWEENSQLRKCSYQISLCCFLD